MENLSFRTPSSSNICTTLSVVHTARRFPLGAQQRAVTLTIPSLGCVIDCKCFSCILNFSHNFTQFFEEARIINKPDVILSIGYYPQADSIKDTATRRNRFLLSDYVLSSNLPNSYISAMPHICLVRSRSRYAVDGYFHSHVLSLHLVPHTNPLFSVFRVSFFFEKSKSIFYRGKI